MEIRLSGNPDYHPTMQADPCVSSSAPSLGSSGELGHRNMQLPLYYFNDGFFDLPPLYVYWIFIKRSPQFLVHNFVLSQRSNFMYTYVSHYCCCCISVFITNDNVRMPNQFNRYFEGAFSKNRAKNDCDKYSYTVSFSLSIMLKHFKCPYWLQQIAHGIT